jgi:C4-dicarboxylate-specific signal transduction histidine kinase
MMGDDRPRRVADSLPPAFDGEAEQRVLAANLAELGVLTASLLHELRQPLFAIKGYTQLARREGGSRPDRLDRVLEQVEHIEALIGYYGSGGQPEPPAVFDLNNAVRRAVSIATHRAHKIGVLLEEKLADAPVRVLGSEIGAVQVVSNLLQNAYDAVEVQPTDCRKVSLSTRFDNGRCLVEVEDTGPGVAPWLADRLFDPFVTSKAKGTGLGLFIARQRVVQAMGEIRHFSRDGGGARFVVDLPSV